MSTTCKGSPPIAESRAGAYALIAAGFRYPRSVPLRELAECDFWEHTLAPFADEGGERFGACGAIRNTIEYLLQGEASLEDAQSKLESEYASLFGHAVRGVCPPYELEYGSGEIVQRAPDLADIAGFYSAFGLEVAADSDRPDHITAQCEFMSLLCVKEAAAESAGSMDHVEQCRSAQRAFLKDHLGCWLPAFTHRVSEQVRTGFYADLASFAFGFIESECRRFHLPVGATWIELRPLDPERDTSIECGPEDACVPGGSDRLVQLNVP